MMSRRFGSICFLASSIFLAAPVQAGEPIRLEARLAQPVMKGGEAQKNYLRIGLQGCKPEPNQNRTPVNISLVIDRSGSMAGERLQQARAAAIMAVNRLLPSDVASVVIFDNSVDVLVAAQKVTNPGMFIDAITRIASRGETAIHAGVLIGAAEVRKFKDPARLNRVVLLSDGQANVGPTRPSDFAALGKALLDAGISVTTIGLGLGYNEDLMLQLARASDGNHAFARDPSDLVNIFNKEFDDVLGSCAQTVSVDIDLKPGMRVVKALSREGVIKENSAKFQFAQIYAATEHYVLVEVELDKSLAIDGENDLGIVKVAYTAPESGARQTLDTAIHARFSSSDAEVQKSRDPKVAEAVLEQVTRARAQEAVKLRDMGNVSGAALLFQQNATDLNSALATMPMSDRMLQLQKQYEALSAAPSPTKPASAQQLNMERKVLRQLDANTTGATRY